jgi:general L-amino acid transport system ATP-binding protein
MTTTTDYSDATRVVGEAIIDLEAVDKFFGDFQALKGIDMKVGQQ